MMHLTNTRSFIFLASVLFCSAAFAEQSGSVAATPNDLDRQAFKHLMQEYFPLTPNQIHEYKSAEAAQQEAIARGPDDVPPEGHATIVPVSLKPGQAAPVIRVGQGMITSVVFTDVTGDVWPIVSYSVGNPQAFNISWDQTSGVLMVQGMQYHAQSNIGVMLKGLSIPVMLNLLIGQKNWDYLDYVRVDSAMPGNELAAKQLVDHVSPALINLLQGIPPSGSQKLDVDQDGVQVWSSQGSQLILTRSTLLSPSWVGRADGPGPNPLHAYELPATPYVILSQDGKMQKVKIGEARQQ
jgi:intracellular multiplication protein IcmK